MFVTTIFISWLARLFLMDDILYDLGLTELEIKIFKLLLREGPSLAGTISRKTGIHRRNTYDALDRLLKRGFVSYIKENNVKSFVATDPKIVLDMLDAKKKQWEAQMPAISAMMEGWAEKKETLFFRGKNGIRHVFLDQIEVREEVLVLGTTFECDKLISHFFPKYHLLRLEKKIKTRMLFDESIRKSSDYKTLQKQKLTSLKFVSGLNTTNVSQYVYGDTVAIIGWSDSPFAIVVKEKSVADFYRQQFELFWRNA